MSAIEWTAALFGLASVWFTVRQNIWCWPTGLVMVALYVLVFARARLYADMGLQVVYIGLQIYGWHEWLHGGPRGGILRVTRSSPRVRAAAVAAAAAGAGMLGYALAAYTDAALPYWDAAITSMSLVAQWMLARKLLESWLLWIAVDVLAVGVFLNKGLYPTTALYAVFLAMAVMGYREWNRTLKTPAGA